MRQLDGEELEAGEVADDAASPVISTGGWSPEAIVPGRERGLLRDEAMSSVLEALDVKRACELRIPGIAQQRTLEGPQSKLRLCEWLDEKHAKLGGGDEALKSLLILVSKHVGKSMTYMKMVYEDKGKWIRQCGERGATSVGLTRSESHLPRYLRKSMRSKGQVVRAKGGGRRDYLEFLYPLVRDWFEEMRLHGKYVDARSLLEHFMHVMTRYLEEADKPEVMLEAKPEDKSRVQHVRSELERLRDPQSSKEVSRHRENKLMNVCHARLRTPQRLTKLTLAEEEGRWRTTLMAYDRIMWEAMRAEQLKDRVVDPKRFVEQVKDTVICHCDQVPIWLKVGSMRQLFAASELKSSSKNKVWDVVGVWF